jgi:hypothetical protein
MDERNKHLGVQSGAVSPFKSPNLNEKLTNTKKRKGGKEARGSIRIKVLIKEPDRIFCMYITQT